MPMRTFARGPRQHALLPGTFLLRGVEGALLAMDDQRMHGDILRHLPLQRLVDEAHHRQVAGKFRIAQEAVRHQRPARRSL